MKQIAEDRSQNNRNTEIPNTERSLSRKVAKEQRRKIFEPALEDRKQKIENRK